MNNGKKLVTIALQLVRDHYENDDAMFDASCKELEEWCYDHGEINLAEYAMACRCPACAFVTMGEADDDCCVLVYGENDHGDDGWWCQSCGEWFAASFRHTGRNNIIKPSYCQHCGKAVKR